MAVEAAGADRGLLGADEALVLEVGPAARAGAGAGVHGLGHDATAAVQMAALGADGVVGQRALARVGDKLPALGAALGEAAVHDAVAALLVHGVALRALGGNALLLDALSVGLGETLGTAGAHLGALRVVGEHTVDHPGDGPRPGFAHRRDHAMHASVAGGHEVSGADGGGLLDLDARTALAVVGGAAERPLLNESALLGFVVEVKPVGTCVVDRAVVNAGVSQELVLVRAGGHERLDLLAEARVGADELVLFVGADGGHSLLAVATVGRVAVVAVGALR
mmetsp:Transcript_97646/g.146341  ORF Transcript_97646/g.146341 Transcript_97646/m.146341 type:complete len:280 (-) Transcript_97646:1068-1907(-)